MMIDTLRALTVAANSLRFNPEIDPDAAGRYEKVLTNLRDKLGRDMGSNPLTLDELREMDGEPVWLEIAGGVWGLVDIDDNVVWLDHGGSLCLVDIVGLAYRRKPEGEEENGKQR